jgi:hypothetical protein
MGRVPRPLGRPSSRVAADAGEAREHAAATVEDGFGVVDQTAADLVVEVYKAAFQRFEETLRTADEQAKGKELLKDLAIGLAVGMVVGASLGYALAGVAATTPLQAALKATNTNLVNWGGKQTVKPSSRAARVRSRAGRSSSRPTPNCGASRRTRSSSSSFAHLPNWGW